MTILGLHHLTLVSADARRTLAFYSGVLGLRFVKKTVNFDSPASYHLYFADATGRPGTIITFFESPQTPRGTAGIGGTHHFAFTVSDFTGLLKWKRRLTDLGVTISGPTNQKYFLSMYFSDPDGATVEIATQGPGMATDEPPDQLGTSFMDMPASILEANRDETRIRAASWPDPVPEISADMALCQGIHHITAICLDVNRTHAFWHDVMGLRRVKMTANFNDGSNSPHWYWATDNSHEPGGLLSYFEQKSSRVRAGAGQAQHFALAVPDEAALQSWREKLLAANLPVSEVRDSTYFKSIFSRDPDGHVIQLATLGPGFTVDEPLDQLGQSLKLPAWLEAQRSDIIQFLGPLDVPVWRPFGESV